MTEIKVRSGFNTGRISILQANRQAAVKSVIYGAAATAAAEVASVAQDTGAMRQGFMKGIKRSGFRFTISKTRIVVKGETVKELIKSLGPEYAKYHIIQDASFNPQFAAGYKRPSSPFTRPIDMDEVMKTYAKEVRDRIKKEQRKRGNKAR